jgi:hypothetical protein
VWVVEGKGFVVHHVLFGGVEGDVGEVGVGEGTFLKLGEDAVGTVSCAVEVDRLGSVFGSRGGHDVDVADVIDGVEIGIDDVVDVVWSVM